MIKFLLNLTPTARNTLLSLIFILAFFLIIILNSSISQEFEFNPDEGINLIKTSLYQDGFSLYKEIWSDQPPILTVLLSYWLKLFKPSIYHARIFILIFSLILLWSFHQTIKTLSGIFSANIAIIFLLLSIMYVRLSISIMIGIPALSFAMLSIYYATLYKKNCPKYLLLLSGFFMALSLQTKFFTIFLIPLIFLELTYTHKQKIKTACLWLGTIFSIYFIIATIFFYPDFHLFIPQLFAPHLKPINLPCNKLTVIYSMLLQDYDIALLALLSILLNINQKIKKIWLPFSWLLIALIILTKHRPVWDHYYLLISIPICWLAAIRVKKFFKNYKQKKFYHKVDWAAHWLTAGLIILVIINLPAKFNRTKASIWSNTAKTEQVIITLLGQYKNQTHWIVTDMPIFAFYTDMLVPPEIAVSTLKRRFSNNLSSSYFINILKKYKPEQILLGRFQDYPLEIISYIDENYINIYRGLLSKKTKDYYGMRDYLPFNLHLNWHKKPLGEYLPYGIRFTSNKTFYNLIWNSLYIPHPIFAKKQKIFYTQYTKINLFIRKDIITQNQLESYPLSP